MVIASIALATYTIRIHANGAKTIEKDGCAIPVMPRTATAEMVEKILELMEK